MMQRLKVSSVLAGILTLSFLLTVWGAENSDAQRKRQAAQSAAGYSRATAGSLEILDDARRPVGSCPLKHTDVKATIGGFLARVDVTQEFENVSPEKIEAVYTFPLSQNSAVDDMTIYVGKRTVRGTIKRREEARAIYEAAKSSGHVAALLDQERPNIFTQSIANILPGEKIKVKISYVEILKYNDGSYKFVFPLVVGPRYIPGNPAGKTGGGWAPDTDRVPDASRITPPVTPENTRAGHDVSILVKLDAGVPIDALRSMQHDVDVKRATNSTAALVLRDKAVIPNKDFVFEYDVAGRNIEEALLTHYSSKLGGFFTMILQPPERVTVAEVTSKELVFVLDTSGSMQGFPIEKAKETMSLALNSLYPQDTFNLITFAGDTHILFPEPVPATRENLRKAQEFLASRSGSGGTEMMKAIRAALDPSDRQNHMRIVCFMTDGYVGNDMEIIAEVQRHPNARVFAFGIGSSVNRFLLDKMSDYGRGEVEYVSLQDDGSAAARRFHERVRNPLLTDISVRWNGVQVEDVYPRRTPDLFSAKPLVLCGRFYRGGYGTVEVEGMMAGRRFTRRIPVTLPQIDAGADVLATLWAREKIDDLMGNDYEGIQQGNARPDIREEITQLGLQYRLMTQFTSFVAVEEMVVTDGGQPRRIEVPVEMPEGVSREGVFGRSDFIQPAAMPMSKTSYNRAIATPGIAGSGVGIVGGVIGRPQSERTSGGEAQERGSNDKRFRDEERQQQLASKLHPAVAAVIARIEKGNAQPTAAESRFVRRGKAELQVWLTAASGDVLALLKQLGFEVIAQPKSHGLVLGRIAVEKLSALAQLKEVRYIAPLQ
ncbi:MAG TPA: VIT and VWA domain-containing protein [Acidobacteriota bacterium]|jgi:Ca-activated chloride channel family protein